MFSGNNDNRRINLSGKKQVIIDKELFMKQAKKEKETTVLFSKQNKALKRIISFLQHNKAISKKKEEIKKILKEKIIDTANIKKSLPAGFCRKLLQKNLFKFSVYASFLYSKIECFKHYANHNQNSMYEPVRILIEEVILQLHLAEQHNNSIVIDEQTEIKDTNKKESKAEITNKTIMSDTIEMLDKANIVDNKEITETNAKHEENRNSCVKENVEEEKHNKCEKCVKYMENDKELMWENESSILYRRKRELMILVEHLEILLGMFYFNGYNIYKEVEEDEFLIIQIFQNSRFFVLKKKMKQEKEFNKHFYFHVYKLYNIILGLFVCSMCKDKKKKKDKENKKVYNNNCTNLGMSDKHKTILNICCIGDYHNNKKKPLGDLKTITRFVFLNVEAICEVIKSLYINSKNGENEKIQINSPKLMIHICDLIYINFLFLQNRYTKHREQKVIDHYNCEKQCRLRASFLIDFLLDHLHYFKDLFYLFVSFFKYPIMDIFLIKPEIQELYSNLFSKLKILLFKIIRKTRCNKNAMQSLVYKYNEIRAEDIYHLMKTKSADGIHIVGVNLFRNMLIYMHLNKDLLEDNVIDILVELYLFLPLKHNPFIQTNYSLYHMEGLFQPEINALNFLNKQRRRLRKKIKRIKNSEKISSSLQEPQKNSKDDLIMSNGNKDTSTQMKEYVEKETKQIQLHSMLKNLEIKGNAEVEAYLKWWEKKKRIARLLTNEKYKLYTTLGKYFSKDIIESLIYMCKRFHFNKLDAILFLLMPFRAIHNNVLEHYRNYYDYMKNIDKESYWMVPKKWRNNAYLIVYKWAHRYNDCQFCIPDIVKGTMPYKNRRYLANYEYKEDNYLKRKNKLNKNSNKEENINAKELTPWYHLGGTMKIGNLGIETETPRDNNCNYADQYSRNCPYRKAFILQSHGKFTMDCSNNVQSTTHIYMPALFLPKNMRRIGNLDKVKNVFLLKINKILIENNVHVHLINKIYWYWQNVCLKNERMLFSEIGLFPYFDHTLISIYVTSLSVLLYHFIVEQYFVKLIDINQLKLNHSFFNCQKTKEVFRVLTLVSQFALFDAINSIHYSMIYPDNKSNTRRNKRGRSNISNNSMDIEYNYRSDTTLDNGDDDCEMNTHAAVNYKVYDTHGQYVQSEEKFEIRIIRKQEQRIEKIAKMWNYEFGKKQKEGEHCSKKAKIKGFFGGGLELERKLQKLSLCFEKDKNMLIKINEEASTPYESIYEKNTTEKNCSKNDEANTKSNEDNKCSADICNSSKNNSINEAHDPYERYLSRKRLYDNLFGVLLNIYTDEQHIRQSINIVNGKICVNTEETTIPNDMNNNDVENGNVTHFNYVRGQIETIRHNQKNNTFSCVNSKQYYDKTDILNFYLYTQEKRNMLFLLPLFLKKLNRFNRYVNILKSDFLVLESTYHLLKQHFIPLRDDYLRLHNLQFYDRYPNFYIDPGSPYVNRGIKYVDVLINYILRKLPFTFSFEDRVLLFCNYKIMQKRHYRQPVFGNLENLDEHFFIRRNNLTKDAFALLQTVSKPELKRNIQIAFVDSHGIDERGIDGGGLFKEFVNLVSRHIFGPKFILFQSAQDNTVFPRTYGKTDNLFLYYLAGRLVGKSLSERILIDSFFNEAFLNILLFDRDDNRKNLNDLQFLDRELFHNMLYIQNVKGVENYSLTFSVMDTYDNDENQNGIPLRTYKQLTKHYQRQTTNANGSWNRCVTRHGEHDELQEGRRVISDSLMTYGDEFSFSDDSDEEGFEGMFCAGYINDQSVLREGASENVEDEADDEDDEDEADDEDDEDDEEEKEKVGNGNESVDSLQSLNSYSVKGLREMENMNNIFYSISSNLHKDLLVSLYKFSYMTIRYCSSNLSVKTEFERNERLLKIMSKNFYKIQFFGSRQLDVYLNRLIHSFKTLDKKYSRFVKKNKVLGEYVDNKKKKKYKGKKRERGEAEAEAEAEEEEEEEEEEETEDEDEDEETEDEDEDEDEENDEDDEEVEDEQEEEQEKLYEDDENDEEDEEDDPYEKLYKEQYEKGDTSEKLYGEQYEEDLYDEGDEEDEKHEEKKENDRRIVKEKKKNTLGENSGIKLKWDRKIGAHRQDMRIEEMRELFYRIFKKEHILKNEDEEEYEEIEEITDDYAGIEVAEIMQKMDYQLKEDKKKRKWEKRWESFWVLGEGEKDEITLGNSSNVILEDIDKEGQEEKKNIKERKKNQENYNNKMIVSADTNAHCSYVLASEHMNINLTQENNNIVGNSLHATIINNNNNNNNNSTNANNNGLVIPYLNTNTLHNFINVTTYNANASKNINKAQSKKKKKRKADKCVDLIRNGRKLLVTDENKEEYLKLYINHKYRHLVQKKVQWFAKGISDVIPLYWLKIFTAEELKIVLSGNDTCFEVNDLKKNVVLTGYNENSKTILNLYEILEEFTPEEKRLFLMFVTSCSRPPLLGFQELDPKFGISRWETPDRLPTASTCVNLLKLPDYATKADLKKNLLKAICETEGFDLQ